MVSSQRRLATIFAHITSSQSLPYDDATDLSGAPSHASASSMALRPIPPVNRGSYRLPKVGGHSWTGGEAVIRALHALGVDVCFANAGTTEVPICVGFSATPGFRVVQCLHENIVTGAADGYARIMRKPALALLHLGFGLSNGVANLWNAHRGRVPLVAVIGDHATYHLGNGPANAMNVVDVAKTASQVCVPKCPEDCADAAVDCFAAAVAESGCASLVMPIDLQRAPVPALELPTKLPARPIATIAELREVADSLRSRAKAVALILSGTAAFGQGLRTADDLRHATGCSLFSPNAPTRLERGRGVPFVHRLKYFPEDARDQLCEFEIIVTVGDEMPVALFAYEGSPLTYLDESRQRLFKLADRKLDAAGTLDALFQMMGLPPGPGSMDKPQMPTRPGDDETLSAHIAGSIFAELLPVGACVVDESISNNWPIFECMYAAAAHDYCFGPTGASIGVGPPLAVGCAIAGRRVLNINGDGSAMYSLQALWTQARERLPVCTVILKNNSYRIVELEAVRANARSKGDRWAEFTEMSGPEIDWIRLGESLGVPGGIARTARELRRNLKVAFASPGPYIVEMIIP